MAMGIVHNIIFESLDGFQVLTAETGSVSQCIYHVTVSTGPTWGGMGHIAKLFDRPTEAYSWNKKRTFHVTVAASISPDPGPWIYIGIGDPMAFDKGIAFYFFQDKIRGLSFDGSDLETVDLITGLGPGYTFYGDLKFIHNPGENVKFYIDGILKGTATLYIPAGYIDEPTIFQAHASNGAEQQHTLEFAQIRFDQDL